MRIIHTSDWHLGKSFGPFSLHGDQESFTDWLVDLAADQQADLVVIAGDIYDRAIAPVESIELFRDTVRRLLASGVTVAAVTGNHDGADRVAPYSELLDLSGFFLRGGYQDIGRVITREFSDGPLDLALLPFLDPQAAPDTFGFEDAEVIHDTVGVGDSSGEGCSDSAGGATGSTGHDSTETLIYRRRVRDHEAVLTTAADAARASLRSARSIVLAHAYVSGATPSDSERQLVVGGTGEVPASLFEGFTYTALGHLHRPQTAGGSSVRYSGSPLAYSFSEDHDKSVVVIDIAPDGSTDIATVVIDPGRRVVTVEGLMSELCDPTRFPQARDRFVRAIVTDRGTVLDARSRLAEPYPYVTEVQLMPDGMAPELGAAPARIRELSPIEATRAFWEAAEGSPPDEELDAVLAAAVTSATVEDGN